MEAERLGRNREGFTLVNHRQLKEKVAKKLFLFYVLTNAETNWCFEDWEKILTEGDRDFFRDWADRFLN